MERETNNIELELSSLKYLIHNMYLMLYNIHDEVFKTKTHRPITTINESGKDISFDLFTIPLDKYNRLIELYGNDVVIQSCCLLDNFIKENNYIPYKSAYTSLKNKFIREVLKKIVDKNASSNAKAINYQDISTQEQAKEYIKSIPPHLRNVDANVEELILKYNLGNDDE